VHFNLINGLEQVSRSSAGSVQVLSDACSVGAEGTEEVLMETNVDGIPAESVLMLLLPAGITSFLAQTQQCRRLTDDQVSDI
jgi:hypothetical protein